MKIRNAVALVLAVAVTLYWLAMIHRPHGMGEFNPADILFALAVVPVLILSGALTLYAILELCFSKFDGVVLAVLLLASLPFDTMAWARSITGWRRPRRPGTRSGCPTGLSSTR
ncbi:MAG: hypothetical protein WDO13_10825 [Verrucomicrobiota bacterium]